MTGLFAAVFIALYAGHEVADHWVQRERQALGKSGPGWPGRLYCARHVLALTLVLAVSLAAVSAVTGARVTIPAAAAALAVNAISHYWADRRLPLRTLARIAGKSEFWDLGSPREGHDDNVTLGTGAYHLDQAWHIAWLLITALIITGVSR